MTRTLLQSTVKRVGAVLYREMSRLSRAQAVVYLIGAFFTDLQEYRASRKRDCARMLAVMMDELKTFPSPAHSHLLGLVECICVLVLLTQPDTIEGRPGTAMFLARSLGKAIHAIRTNAFFVRSSKTS